MKVIRSADALARYVASIKTKSQSIGFVPTMGALHSGHYSLVEKSVSQNDVTIVSIFVNPLQFGPTEDLATYPRTFKEDSLGLKIRGVAVLFFPEYQKFYTDSHQTYVTNRAVQHLYCGGYRDGHFDGVLTVVSKLFNCVQPNRAYFGRKDYQQAYLIKKMVVDLSYPIKIVLGATVREKSGLAMSSRNEYLSQEDRMSALAISKGLSKAYQLQREKPHTVTQLKDVVAAAIEKSTCREIQYVEVVSRETLLPLTGKVTEKAVILVAAFYGATRLIDNREI
ncbi:MAG: pantoate--beta-alanine ligase [Fibrobacterales bacterium]